MPQAYNTLTASLSANSKLTTHLICFLHCSIYRLQYELSFHKKMNKFYKKYYPTSRFHSVPDTIPTGIRISTPGTTQPNAPIVKIYSYSTCKPFNPSCMTCLIYCNTTVINSFAGKLLK